jgi:hypothetical protein
MAQKKVFISHSTQDAVLARLIVHILEKQGKQQIKCLYLPRDVQTGRAFDERILELIHQANILLIVWTDHAALSAWVNQEVGIALRDRIPIFPLFINDTRLQGAILFRQGRDLARENNPHAELKRIAQEIAVYDPGAQPIPLWTIFGEERRFVPIVDKFFHGRLERNQGLAAILEEYNKKPRPKYTLRIQAAFSSFAISDDRKYRDAGNLTPIHHAALVKELREVEKMASWAKIQMILWPKRQYANDAFTKIRFKNLLCALMTNRSFARMQVVIGQHDGPNRYIFDGDALLEGRDASASLDPGYDLTTLTFQGPTITSAINDFDRDFRRLWKEHATGCKANPKTGHSKLRRYVIDEIRRMAPDGSPTQAADC